MAEHLPWYYKLSPDVFSRYFVIKEIIKKLYGKQAINVLDVGGKENSLWAMVADEGLPYDLTVIDILPADARTEHYKYIQHDATAMPFAENAYEVVISTDALEHIPDAKKEAIIAECLRVAKDYVIIAAPFNSQLVDQAEHIANDYFKSFSGNDHLWLSEHFVYHKPEKKQIEKIIKQERLPYLDIQVGNLQNWLLMVLSHFYAVKIGYEPDVLQSLTVYFNKNFFQMGEFSEPGYRDVYIVGKNKSDLTPVANFLKQPYDSDKQNYWQQQMMLFFIASVLQSPDSETELLESLRESLALLTRKKNGQTLFELLDDSTLTYKSTHDAKHMLARIKNALSENQNLKLQIAQMRQHVFNLEQQYNQITKSKFFALWQLYDRLKQ